MGTVKAYSTKTKGRMYEVWYTKPDGTRGHDRGFKLKRDAEAHLATVEVAKLRGSYVDPADSKIRISELGPAWPRNGHSDQVATIRGPPAGLDVATEPCPARRERRSSLTWARSDQRESRPRPLRVHARASLPARPHWREEGGTNTKRTPPLPEGNEGVR